MMGTAAARMKLHRQRQAAGKIPLRIEVPEIDVAELLIEANLLQQSEREDRDKIARGIEKLLDILCRLECVTL
jgi:hypothetical protein